MVQLSHPYKENHSFDYTDLCREGLGNGSNHVADIEARMAELQTLNNS